MSTFMRRAGRGRTASPARSGDLGPGLLPPPRHRPVAAAQEREVHEGHVDLLRGELGGGPTAVAEVDGDLAQPEAVQPGLVGHLAVHDVTGDLDALEVRRLQHLAPVATIAAG